MKSEIVRRASAGMLAALLWMGLLLGAMPGVTAMARTPEGFAGGSGTADDPWQIATPEQLDLLHGYVGREHKDKHFLLVGDIDLTEYLSPGGAGHAQWGAAGWMPIGSLDDRFFGVLDGGGYAVQGIWFEHPDSIYAGLISYMDVGSAVLNLGLEIAEGKAMAGRSYIGGIVGRSSGTIAGCYVTGTVIGFESVGGIAGVNNPGLIENCYSTAAVAGELGVGGLVGQNSQDGATIQNCYATGDVTGDWPVGGLVGQNFKGLIVNCYSNSRVRGGWDEYVGGFCGSNPDSEGEIAACYYNIDTAGQDVAVGNGSGDVSGLPAGEMHTEANFPGWDFDGGTWGIYEGYGPPYLAGFENDILILPDGSGSVKYNGLIPPTPGYAVEGNYNPDKPLRGEMAIAGAAPDAGMYRIAQGNLGRAGYQITFWEGAWFEIQPAHTAVRITGSFTGVTQGGSLTVHIEVAGCYNSADEIAYTLGERTGRAALVDGRARIVFDDLTAFAPGIYPLEVHYFGDKNHLPSAAERYVDIAGDTGGEKNGDRTSAGYANTGDGGPVWIWVALAAVAALGACAMRKQRV